MKRTFSLLMLTLILVSTVTVAFKILPVKAAGTIYIRADGSIDPPTALISTVDNVTYTFTDNIYDSIVVERDNITVDGADYSLIGPADAWALNLSARENVAIRNVKIKLFTYGIYMDGSSNNSILENNIANNNYGIYLRSSSNNRIF